MAGANRYKRFLYKIAVLSHMNCKYADTTYGKSFFRQHKTKKIPTFKHILQIQTTVKS